MWWQEFFWIVYGVGSTLFVFFLFKLGNAVANNHQESIKQDIEQPQSSNRARTVVGHGVTSRSPDHSERVPDQRAARARKAKVGEAVATVEANNEIGLATGGFHNGSGFHRQTEQGRRFL